jgi:uncharacterized protein (DUF58 family)
VFGVGFAALNTGNNLLYLVLALMLAFLVLSGLLSEASLRGIRIERHLPRELFAHASSRVVLRIHNDQKRLAAFAITLEDRFESAAGPEIAGRSFVLRVPPSTSVDRSYVFEPAQRGELLMMDARVSTRFPFGLFVKSAELECESSALVYPRLEAVSAEARYAESGQDAEERACSSKTGEQVTGLREYAPGDSIGRVHWRRSLRAHRWLIGEREGESAAEIEVLLQVPPQAASSVVEERVSQAASEIVAHLEAGLSVGLRTPNERFAVSSGFAHRTELLSYLARFDPRSAPPASAFRRRAHA